MIQFSRQWAMPSADTFDIPPIREFVKKYLRQSKVSIDPFARNKRWATYTNDLNPDTVAEYHMDALDFLKMLKTRGVVADLVILDPPYSPRQISELYKSIGMPVTTEDTQNVVLYSKAKRLLYDMLAPDGWALTFGWNSVGMKNTSDKCIEIVEIMMVCHGHAHNDTICMAERKIAHQAELTLDMGIAT